VISTHRRLLAHAPRANRLARLLLQVADLAQVIPTHRRLLAHAPRATRLARHLLPQLAGLAQMVRLAQAEPVTRIARPGSVARRTARLPPEPAVLAGVRKISAPPAAVAPLIGRLEMSPAG
jgi:hypothetical protein